MKSNASLEIFLAQHFFIAFMWAITDYISTEALGPTDILGIERLLDHDMAKAWRSPRLQNNLLAEIARSIEGVGLGSMEDILLSIIPPLSQAGKLASDAMGNLVGRVLDKQNRLDSLIDQLDRSGR